MKKLIIHIGYPKTATTSLQLNLFAGLKEEGKIEYLNHLNIKNEYLGNVYCRETVAYINGQKSIFNSFEELEIMKNIFNKISVISNENISFFSKKFNWAFQSSKALDNAERIAKVFEKIFDKIEIIIGIRAQKTIIPSFYIQQYNLIISEMPEFKNYNKWLEANFGKEIDEKDLFLNYEEIYKKYCDIFGSENVHLLIFEDLKYDKNYFFKILANIFRLEIRDIKNIFDKPIKNKTKITENGYVLTSKPTIGQLLVTPFKYRLERHFNEDQFKKVKSIYKNILPTKFRNLKFGKVRKIKITSLNTNNYFIEKFYKSNFRLSELALLEKEKMRKYGYYK